jgi:hypothetical protein
VEERVSIRGQVAQVVERSPEKAGVGGSTPSLATILINSEKEERSVSNTDTSKFAGQRDVIDLSLLEHELRFSAALGTTSF